MKNECEHKWEEYKDKGDEEKWVDYNKLFNVGYLTKKERRICIKCGRVEREVFAMYGYEKDKKAYTETKIEWVEDRGGWERLVFGGQ
jgi:hypothetical protein